MQRSPSETSRSTSRSPTLERRRRRGVPRLPSTWCPLCLVPDCEHQVKRREQFKLPGLRDVDIAPLMQTSYIHSYMLNPLFMATKELVADLNLCSFQDLSILDGDVSRLGPSLYKFIAFDMGHNTPFTDPQNGSIDEISADWLLSASTDDLACTATLACWANIEHANTRDSNFLMLALKCTSRLLKLLREAVEVQKSANDGAIFAASAHICCTVLFHKDKHNQCQNLMDGLEAMIKSRGGVDNLANNGQPGLFTCLLWADTLTADVTAQEPRFSINNPPPMPSSLSSIYRRGSVIDEVYQECCSPEILDMVRYLRLLLLFRHGAELRPLTRFEFRYLVVVYRYVVNQILTQTARYADTQTTTECVVLAVAVVRLEVFNKWHHHRVIRRCLRQRLMQAVKTVQLDTWEESGCIWALVWICIVALTQPSDDSERAFFRSVLAQALSEALSPDPNTWPANWLRSLGKHLPALLWHPEYDRIFLDDREQAAIYLAAALRAAPASSDNS